MATALEYAQELIRFGSISSVSNADVSDYVERVLKTLGCETERIEYDDAAGVRKVSVLGRKGPGAGGLAYFGHTDVVPADTWKFTDHGPFDPIVKDGRLYGRGACDMKGSVACMLAAAERFSAEDLKAPVYITCTADEEVGYGGALQVAARSEMFREMVDHDTRGIIGEPTLLEVVYSHKGTYGFRVVSHGRAAHSSTREGLNANLAMIPFLVEMKAIHDETESDPRWQNEEFDPPTVTWNIGVNDFTRAVNITAPQSVCTVYFRAMPGMDAMALWERSRKAAEANGLEFQEVLLGEPLYVAPDSPFVQDMLALSGRKTPRTVSYGTDGAAFTALKRMVVFGPGSIAQAHTHDEWIALDQLDRGTQLYADAIKKFCT